MFTCMCIMNHVYCDTLLAIGIYVGPYVLQICRVCTGVGIELARSSVQHEYLLKLVGSLLLSTHSYVAS